MSNNNNTSKNISTQYPTDFNPQKDVLFAKSQGNLFHTAQKVYREGIEATFEAYFDGNKARLYMQFKKDINLIQQAKQYLQDNLGADYRCLVKTVSNQTWTLVSEKNKIDNLIWDSLKRKKASRRQNDLKERAILEMIAESSSKIDKSPKRKKRVSGCKQSPKKKKDKTLVKNCASIPQKVSICQESDHDSSSFEEKEPITKRRKVLHRKVKEINKSSKSTKMKSRSKKKTYSDSDSDSDSDSNDSDTNNSYSNNNDNTSAVQQLKVVTKNDSSSIKRTTKSSSEIDKSPKGKKRVSGCKQSPKKKKDKTLVKNCASIPQKVSICQESDHDSSSFEEKEPITKRRKVLHRKVKEINKSSKSTKMKSRSKKKTYSDSDSDSDSDSNDSDTNNSYSNNNDNTSAVQQLKVVTKNDSSSIKRTTEKYEKNLEKEKQKISNKMNDNRIKHIMQSDNSLCEIKNTKKKLNNLPVEITVNTKSAKSSTNFNMEKNKHNKFPEENENQGQSLDDNIQNRKQDNVLPTEAASSKHREKKPPNILSREVKSLLRMSMTDVIDSNKLSSKDNGNKDNDSANTETKTACEVINSSINDNVVTGIQALINRKPDNAAFYKMVDNTFLGKRTMNHIRKTKVMYEPRDDPRCNFTIDTSWSISTIKSKLKLRLANVPKDGNCAFTTMTALLDDDENTNHNCYDDTVVKCRRFFVTKLMASLSTSQVYEYLYQPGKRLNFLCSALEQPFTKWYNAEKEDMYLYKNEDTLLDEDTWMDNNLFFPTLAMILKKSIVVITCDKVSKNSEKFKDVGQYEYYRFDTEYPEYFPPLVFSELNISKLKKMRNGKKRSGNSIEFKIDVDNTAFVIYYLDVHFDALVANKRTVKNISDGILPIEHRLAPTTKVDEKDHKYVSHYVYNKVVETYKKMLQTFVYSPFFKRGMLKPIKGSDKKKEEVEGKKK